MDRLFEPLGLDHVVLHVRDQAASRRFYTEVLGCSVEHVNEKFSLVQLRFGQSLIDLLPLGPNAPAPAPEHGMDHLCLSIRCDDLETVAAWLGTQGVTVEGEVVKRRGAFGEGPSLYLRDPDGYRIELKPR
jgi:glyoxylase I family protein